MQTLSCCKKAEHAAWAPPLALPVDQVTARQTGLIAVPVPSEVSIGWHAHAVLLSPTATLPSMSKHLTCREWKTTRGAMSCRFRNLYDNPLRIIANPSGA